MTSIFGILVAIAYGLMAGIFTKYLIIFLTTGNLSYKLRFANGYTKEIDSLPPPITKRDRMVRVAIAVVSANLLALVIIASFGCIIAITKFVVDVIASGALSLTPTFFVSILFSGIAGSTIVAANLLRRMA